MYKKEIQQEEYFSLLNKFKENNNILNFKNIIEYLYNIYEFINFKGVINLNEKDISLIKDFLLKIFQFQFEDKEYNFNFISRIIFKIISNLSDHLKIFDYFYENIIVTILSNKFNIINKILCLNILYLLLLNYKVVKIDYFNSINKNLVNDIIKLLNFKDSNFIYILLNLIYFFLKRIKIEDYLEKIIKLVIGLKNIFHKNNLELDIEIKLLVIRLFVIIIKKDIKININIKETIINIINSNNNDINRLEINTSLSKLLIYELKNSESPDKEINKIIDYLFVNINIDNTIKMKHIFEILFNLINKLNIKCIDTNIFKKITIYIINSINEKNYEIENYFNKFLKKIIHFLNPDNVKEIFNYNFENWKIINYNNNFIDNFDEYIENLNLFMNNKNKQNNMIYYEKDTFILFLFLKNINSVLKYDSNIKFNSEEITIIYDYINKNAYKYSNYIQNLFIKMFKLTFEKSKNNNEIIFNIFYEIEELLKDKNNYLKLNLNLDIINSLFESNIHIENYLDWILKIVNKIDTLDKENYFYIFVKAKLIDIILNYTNNEDFLIINNRYIFDFINKFNNIDYNTIENLSDYFFILNSIILANKMIIKLKKILNKFPTILQNYLLTIHNLMKDKKLYQINNNFFNIFKFYFFKILNYFIGKWFPCSTSLLSFLYEDIIENNKNENNIPKGLIGKSVNNLTNLLYNEDEKQYKIYKLDINIKHIRKDYYLNFNYSLKYPYVKYIKDSLFEWEINLMSTIFINKKISLKNKTSIIKNFLVNIKKLDNIKDNERKNYKVFPYFILLIKILNKFEQIKDSIVNSNDEDIKVIVKTIIEIYLFSLHFNELKLRILISYGFMTFLKLFNNDIINDDILDQLMININDNNKRPTIILLNYFLLKYTSHEFIIKNKIYFVNTLSKVSRLEELSSKRFLYLCFKEGLKNLKNNFLEILSPCIPFIYLNFIEIGNYDVVMNYFNLKWINKLFNNNLHTSLSNKDLNMINIILIDIKNLSFSNNLQIIDLFQNNTNRKNIILLNNTFLNKIIRFNKNENNLEYLLNMIIDNFKYRCIKTNIKFLNHFYKKEVSENIQKKDLNFNYIIQYIKDNIINNSLLNYDSFNNFSLIFLKIIDMINFNEFNVNNINMINLSSDIISILIKIQNYLNNFEINILVLKIWQKLNIFFDKFDFKGNEIKVDKKEQIDKLSHEYLAQIINNIISNFDNYKSINAIMLSFDIINYFFKDLYKNNTILFRPILEKIINKLINRWNYDLKILNILEIKLLVFLIDKINIIGFNKIKKDFSAFSSLFGLNFNKNKITNILVYYSKELLKIHKNNLKFNNFIELNSNLLIQIELLITDILNILFSLDIKIDIVDILNDFIINRNNLVLLVKYSNSYNNYKPNITKLFVKLVNSSTEIIINKQFVWFLQKALDLKKNDIIKSVIINHNNIIIKEKNLKFLLDFSSNIEDWDLKQYFYYIIYQKINIFNNINLIKKEDLEIISGIIIHIFDSKIFSNIIELLRSTLKLIECDNKYISMLDYFINNFIENNIFNNISICIKEFKNYKLYILNSLINIILSKDLYQNTKILNFIFNLTFDDNNLLNKYLKWVFILESKEYNIPIILSQLLKSKIKISLNQDTLNIIDEKTKLIYKNYLNSFNNTINSGNSNKIKKLGGLKKL